MLKLTTKQASIMAAIEASPGIQYAALLDQSGIKHGTLSRTIYSLVEKKLIVRVGKTHRYKHYAKEVKYEVCDKGEPKFRTASNEPDPLVSQASSATLTDEQKFYAKNHQHISRTKLAKMFGMSKLEFNFALAKR